VRGIFGFRKEHLEAAVELFETNKLRPMIGKAFSWENAVEAFRVSMGHSIVGKVVIRI